MQMTDNCNQKVVQTHAVAVKRKGKNAAKICFFGVKQP